ncbi:hypothetical protein AQPE_0862 [Aquipluma nitroreducens]|uniref:Uncharacterized protein n=1 Tax=Aquipluma nitroreducens TaxID=2010828 RepID=A0A5K7S5C3_9BACT|nr:ammonia-forming cytochrome c nitrite reductase subunit c552 [Aquipluma nitroreducens]BBE16719.1 hypothetical protein AQPE_0862 [Aquipluma nitroreducens]
MKLNNFSKLLLSALVVMCIAPSCVKEGPMGLTGATGANGKDGTNGTDANQTCKVCHTSTKVDLISTQFQFSKHEYGEAAFEESGNTGCTPCHAQEAFKYVVANNVPATFTLNPATGKYVNNYATVSSAAYGEIGCSTCHSALHTTYGTADLAFTTVAPVPMTMWGGAKVIDLKADGGKSNLCVKCHQPRPFTNALTGNVLDYVALATTTGVVFDGDPAGKTNIIKPSYRTHTHYGAIGAVYAGMGGVEFPGTLPYTNSAHTQAASCMDCHMGAMVGRSGGHTFSAAGKFDGCNVAGCHTTAITSASTTLWVNPRAEIKKLLGDLAAKLTIGGVDILNRNGDSASNLWYGITANNYDGYLNVYDPITNPTAQTYNASSFKYVGTPPATWSAEQKAYNATLPTLTLSNAQMGAIINFQLCLRDYSLGIHNFAYTKALLTNSIAKL